MKKQTCLWLGLIGVLAMFGCDESDDTPEENKPAEAVCGNGTCEAGETAASCAQDCVTQSGDACGDGVCALLENFSNCPQDCKAVCGNHICEKSGGESFDNCKEDCDAPGFCGDGICNKSEGESTTTCSLDCKEKISCGDRVCGKGESRLNCPADCPPVCGDGRCEDPDESTLNCPDDCENIVTEYTAVCGDGTCDSSDETVSSCPEDCAQQGLTQLSLDEFNALGEGKYRFYFDYDKVKQPAEGPAGESDEAKMDRMMNDFYSFPFPSALRTDEYGREDIRYYPMPSGDSILKVVSNIPVLNKITDIIPALVERAQTERKGFSPIGANYFRTTVSLDQKEFPEPAETIKPDSCYQMINVEKTSRHYGERVPLYITNHRGAKTGVWASNTLVLRPVPGAGANPGDRYVTVITDCLTSNGHPINMSNKLRYILEKAAPEEINSKMAYYVDQLKDLETSGKLGFKVKDIRAMTGYQVMDVAKEMDQIAADLKGRGHINTDNKGVAIGQWSTTTSSGWSTAGYNAYIFRGTFTTANYVDGSYPYTGNGEGQITFDENGKLVSQAKEETVNYSIIIPRTPMPANGYPIAVYGHGTGGDADTHCRYYNDEGIVLINGGGGYGIYNKPPKDTAVPMAMIGFDAHLQGKRGNGDIVNATDLVMMILKNPVVIRESWRQTVIDMLVLYDILDNKKLILPPLPDSKDGKNVIFDNSYGLYMGHSQGSQEGGMLLGLTGSIKNAFLSAGGAGIILSFVDLHPDLSKIQVVGEILNGKSVADIVGFILGLDDGDISYDSFITNHIIQALVDPLDPLNYTRRFILEPPNGWEPKNIAQTIALGDQDTPQTAQFAMISSEGLPPIGDLYEVTEPMKLAGFTKSTGASVHNNITNLDGKKVTGASMQFIYTGDDNPHFAIYHMESARMAFVNFFHSVVVDKNVTVSVSGDQTGDQ